MADIARWHGGKARSARFPRRWLLALMIASLPMCALAAPPASVPASGTASVRDDARLANVDWSRLDSQEQQVLAPLHSQWAQLQPWQQQRLRRIVQRWQAMPARRTAIEQRLQRWAAMTPEQRAALGTRYEKFNQLAPEQQQDLRDTYQHFMDLPPEQRQALRQRFEKMTPGERAAFAAGAETAKASRVWQRFMAETPPADRAATRAIWLALSPLDRHALRFHVRPMSAAQRAELRTRLLAMTPEQRNAFIAGLPRAPVDQH